MRLLEDDGHGNLSLVEKHDDDIPRYAILSHTWGADGDEVTFRDLTEGTARNKAGYNKIEFCRAQAASDGLQHFWVDTCCIDKSSSAELSEAINSMFRWYQSAARCYIYLSDVPTALGTIDIHLLSTAWEAAFRRSRWFSRGWTLQELIAPASAEFFSRDKDRLGNKRSLEQIIHEVTGIAIEALRGAPLTGFKVEERFSWANHRATKRQEDKAYSLLGLFDICMPLLYGEGEQRAFVRLREEIGKSAKSSVRLPYPTGANLTSRDDGHMTSHLVSKDSQASNHGANLSVQAAHAASEEALDTTEKSTARKSIGAGETLFSTIITFDTGPKNNDSPLHRNAWYGRDAALRSLLEHYKGAHVLDEQNETPLQRAAWNGHETCLILLLNAGAQIDFEGGYCGSALETAAHRGHIKSVELLVQRGASAKDAALRAAASSDHEQVVRLLIDKGANVRSRSPDGVSVLHAAASGGNVTILRWLLDAGAFDDLVAEEKTDLRIPLDFAVVEGRKDAFFFLLDRGADPHALASGFAGAIVHSACKQADLAFIARLLREHINIDQDGGTMGTPLQVACKEGHLHIVELLLQKKANVNLVCGLDNTALNAALRRDHTRVAQRLLVAGADITPDLPYCKQPLYVAAMQGNETIMREMIAKAEQMGHDLKGHIAALITVVAYGRETSGYTDTKYHPWTRETLESQGWRRRDWHQGHIQVLHLLLEASPAAFLVNHCDRFSKKNSLTFAIGQRNRSLTDPSFIDNTRNLKKIIQVVLENGAPLNETDELGDTPLISAAKSGDCEILNLLLDNGASVDLPDIKGQTALWWGAHMGKRYVVINLLKHGADPQHRSHTGQSPIAVAQKWEQYRNSRSWEHRDFSETLKHIEEYAAGQEEPMMAVY